MGSVSAFFAQYSSALIGFVVLGAITVFAVRFSWRRVSGTQRAWTMAPPIPFQISARNTWPFMVFCFSLAMFVMMLTFPLEIMGWDTARRFIWAGPFWIPWCGVILSFFYWPIFLTPRWYRDWVSHPDYPDRSPWTNDEVVHVLRDMPPSKKRDRMIKDMGWAGVDVEQAWKDLGIPGAPPEEWWEKMKRTDDAENAELGITEDMSLEERVRIRAEHRQAKEAARQKTREQRRDK